ncbi:MAG: hypothetical protein ABJM58_00110 [Alteripontixanthobacter sp.]
MTELIESKRNGPFAKSLHDFARFFEGYREATIAAAKAEGRPEEIPVIEIMGNALIEQSVQLNNRFVGFYDAEESSDLADQLDDYAEATALPLLTQSVAGLVSPERPQARSSGFLGGLLGGLSDIIEPIKKILKLVLAAFPIGGTFGKILDLILDIINNLLNGEEARLGPEAAARARQARATMYEHLGQIFATDKLALERKRAMDALATE